MCGVKPEGLQDAWCEARRMSDVKQSRLAGCGVKHAA